MDYTLTDLMKTVSMMSTVDGRKTGRSFSFKADPKKLAVFKTEAYVNDGLIKVNET